jgi:hypothetical protein
MKLCCAQCKKFFEEESTFCNTPKGLVHPECVEKTGLSNQRDTILEVVPALAEACINREKEAYREDPKDVKRRQVKAKLNVACWMVQTLAQVLRDGTGPDSIRLVACYQDEKQRLLDLREELLALEEGRE